MIYFSEQFLMAESNEIEYNGKIIQRFYRFDKIGEYIFHFSFLSSNSKLKQAIALYYGNLVGNIFLGDVNLSKKKSTFSRLTFFEDTAPKQFELNVQINGGHLTICNGSVSDKTDSYCHTLSFGCAMIIEEVGENHLRFFCNDHENDDDFDDLVFELEIKPKA